MIPDIVLQDHFVHALVWTIIHSLWQFSLMAICMSLLMKVYQHQKAEKRYVIALGSLGLSLVTAAVTFMIMYTRHASGEVNAGIFSQVMDISPNEEAGYSFMSLMYAQIENFRIPIFIAWLTGTVFFVLKFMMSLGYVHFLSSTSSPLYCQDTYTSFRKICAHYSISDNIRIGENKYIKSPMILGVLKPIVLLPVGIVNQLDIKETEAILAHEVAHYVRKDILVNILQTLVESLFYYHPAIWWISANIRIERENSCDDLAISYMSDHISYAKTLIKMQEFYQNTTNPALALQFNKESFFSQRIKRILNMSQTRYYLKEKIISSVVLIGLVMFFTKDLTGKSSDTHPEKSQQEIIVTVSDTMPQKMESIRIQKKTNDKDIKISIENGEVTNLEINGKKIEEKDYDKYQDIIAESKPKSRSNGDAKIFFFGDEGDSSFDFNILNDSLFRNFGFKGLEDMGGMNFDQGKMNEHLRKLQEQLGQMNFNFQGLDSMNFDFAFPELEKFKNNPEFKIFEFKDGDTFETPFGDDYPNGDGFTDGKNFSEVIGNALNRDGLLIPGKENKVELTGKYLKINGEKQPSNIWNKYKRIFEEESGSMLEKNSRLEFNFTGKEAKRKYRVY